MSADLPARAAVPDRVGRTGGAQVPRYQRGGGSSDILFPIRLRGAELLLEGETEDRPLQLDLVVLLLTCLATSYSNFAAPLVCLDLLGHACREISWGQCPDTVFLFLGSSETFGAARDAAIGTSVQTGRATSAPVWTDKRGANFLIAR